MSDDGTRAGPSGPGSQESSKVPCPYVRRMKSPAPTRAPHISGVWCSPSGPGSEGQGRTHRGSTTSLYLTSRSRRPADACAGTEMPLPAPARSSTRSSRPRSHGQGTRSSGSCRSWRTSGECWRGHPAGQLITSDAAEVTARVKRRVARRDGARVAKLPFRADTGPAPRLALLKRVAGVGGEPGIVDAAHFGWAAR